jgi:ankyrin repeat protein
MSLNPFRNLTSASKRFYQHLRKDEYKKAMAELVAGIDLRDKANVFHNVGGPAFAVIHYAHSEICVSMLEEMFRQGVDPAQLNSSKETLMHAAAKGNRIGVIDFLSKSGCPLNQPDIDGTTPLSCALQRCNRVFFQKLMEMEAFKEGGEKQFESMLPRVVTLDWASTDQLQLLLDAGASLTARYEGNAAIHFAARKKDTTYFLWLKSKGVRVDEPNNYGLYCAQIAAAYDATDVLNDILKDDPDAWKKGRKAGDPLPSAFCRDAASAVLLAHVAARGEDIQPLLDSMILHAVQDADGGKLVRFVRQGGNINVRDHDGRTPLIISVMKGYDGTAATILSMPSCDATLCDNSGKNAFDYASGSKAVNMLQPFCRPELLREEEEYKIKKLQEKGPHETYTRTGDHTLDVKDGGGLTYTFNFWMQVVVIRDKDNKSLSTQAFGDVPRQEAIADAFEKLVEQGGTPPAYDFRKHLNKSSPKGLAQ